MNPMRDLLNSWVDLVPYLRSPILHLGSLNMLFPKFFQEMKWDVFCSLMKSKAYSQFIFWYSRNNSPPLCFTPEHYFWTLERFSWYTLAVITFTWCFKGVLRGFQGFLTGLQACSKGVLRPFKLGVIII